MGSYIVDGKKIADILQKPEPEALDSEFELEDVLSTIKNYRDKVAFLEDLKKKRVAAIKAEILKVEEKAKFLEQVAMLTMENSDKKNLNFPGIAKASIVTRKDKWVVDDSDTLLEELRNKDQAVYEAVVVRKESVAKKALDEILDTWKATGVDLPESVHKEDGTTSLKLNFDKEFTVDDSDPEDFASEDEAQSLDGLDGLSAHGI